MNYVTIATLGLIVTYLIHIGIISSISDSYRTIKDTRLYHAFFFLFAVLIAAQGAYAPDALDILYVVAGFCIFGLSMAAAFWKKEEGWLHVLFTYTGIVIGQTLTVLWLWPTWGVLAILPVGILIVGGLLLGFLAHNITYWREILAVTTIFGPILFI